MVLGAITIKFGMMKHKTVFSRIVKDSCRLPILKIWTLYFYYCFLSMYLVRLNKQLFVFAFEFFLIYINLNEVT